ncbi:MAG: transposase, partial [Sedimentibacter sp.]|nr:transposase [Sedimentibacter sp.]
YWYQHLFWSDGYFVCSIGEASPDTIREYILSQG